MLLAESERKLDPIAPVKLEGSPAAPYAFTTAHPPLLDDYPDVLSIDKDLLHKSVGQPATWSDEVERDISGQVIQYEREYRTFTARRFLRWQLKEPLIRYATDVTREVEHTTGSTEITTSTVAKIFNVKGNFDLYGAVKTEVSASLQLTEFNSKQWTESKKETTKETFKAGSKYAIWILLDVVEIEKSSYKRRFWTKKKQPMQGQSPVQNITGEMQSILYTYNDHSVK